MTLRRLLFSVSALALTLAPRAMAADFTAADAIYAQRENNHDKIASARSAYATILNDAASSNDDKIRAATQIGRLAIYEGEMLAAESDTATRKQIFSDCWSTYIPKIDPSIVGDNPAFYYFKGVCLAYWGEVVSLVEALPHLNDLLNIIKQGEAASYKDYEGGGFFRLGAGVHSNPKAKPFPGHLYDPETALTEINAALASPGMKDPYYGGTVSGQELYENWRGRALVYIELNDKTDAEQAYQDGINLMQADGDVQDGGPGYPSTRTAESDWDLTTDQNELKALQQ